MILPEELVLAPAAKIIEWNKGKGFSIMWLFFEACWPEKTTLSDGLADLESCDTFCAEARGAFAATQGLVDKWGLKDQDRFFQWVPSWVDKVRCINV